ncbi:MAG: hypothetical protein NVS9B10_23070 [Nevskia sp.]
MTGDADFRHRHDATPDTALAQVRDYPGLLLLDLDETAYLRNSTEDFIDCARPGLIALLVLRLLDLIKPWRWTGGEDTRDVWRVRSVRLCLPWIMARWRRQVGELAAAHGNTALLEAVRQRTGPTQLVTVGFTPIVAPLAAALGLGQLGLVAARLDSFADRRMGKLGMANAALGEDAVAGSAVLTDSADDLPLLDRCAQPLRTLWPGACYRRALARVYLPGKYLTQVKRPGQRYILRGILQEDFAFWVLCSIAQAAAPATHFLGLLLLLLSFWAIYERGYVDNDWVAVRYEKDPKLSATFGKIEVATPAMQPWLWAAGAGLLAIWLLRWPSMMALRDPLAWTAVLVGVHVGFKVYNRLDKSSRIWLFPALQLARSAAFVVLVPVGPVATVALGAHVLARWVPYYLYRIGGKDWPEAPFFLSRLMFFITLWLMLAITQDFALVATPTALVLLFWNLFRARKDLAAVLRQGHRIDRPDA